MYIVLYLAVHFLEYKENRGHLSINEFLTCIYIWLEPQLQLDIVQKCRPYSGQIVVLLLEIGKVKKKKNLFMVICGVDCTDMLSF